MKEFIKKHKINDIVSISDGVKSIMFNNIEHPLFAIGYYRAIFVSPDYQYVIKVPIERYDGSNKKLFFETGDTKYLSIDSLYNLLEAKYYEETPKEFKCYLAKAKILQNFWLKQEFVYVQKLNEINVPEFGLKNGKYKLYNYNIVLDFKEQNHIPPSNLGEIIDCLTKIK